MSQVSPLSIVDPGFNRMNARRRLIQIVVFTTALSAAAQLAVAQLPGPFEFSFASNLLNSLFFIPFRLAGCG